MYKGNICVVVNLTQQGSNSKDFLKRFEEFAEEEHLEAGISASFNKLQDLPGIYLQAELAKQKLENKAEAGNLLKYEDYRMEFAIDSIVKVIPSKYYCPKQLYDLIRFDKEHGADLYQTLKAYIRNNCSATDACRELYVVRSTFIYRLSKVKEILGLDLSNPDVRTILALSFKMIEREYG
jgi:DNA-binding PucR family transcriptional regulator